MEKGKSDMDQGQARTEIQTNICVVGEPGFAGPVDSSIFVNDTKAAKVGPSTQSVVDDVPLGSMSTKSAEGILQMP